MCLITSLLFCIRFYLTHNQHFLLFCHFQAHVLNFEGVKIPLFSYEQAGKFSTFHMFLCTKDTISLKKVCLKYPCFLNKLPKLPISSHHGCKKLTGLLKLHLYFFTLFEGCTEDLFVIFHS